MYWIFQLVYRTVVSPEICPIVHVEYVVGSRVRDLFIPPSICCVGTLANLHRGSRLGRRGCRRGSRGRRRTTRAGRRARGWPRSHMRPAPPSPAAGQICAYVIHCDRPRWSPATTEFQMLPLSARTYRKCNKTVRWLSASCQRMLTYMSAVASLRLWGVVNSGPFEYQTKVMRTYLT